MKPTISIIHPSRSRPQMAANTMKKWMSSAKNKAAIEYIMSVDEDDAALDFYEGLVGGKYLL